MIAIPNTLIIGDGTMLEALRAESGLGGGPHRTCARWPARFQA